MKRMRSSAKIQMSIREMGLGSHVAWGEMRQATALRALARQLVQDWLLKDDKDAKH